jgi:hypothetical protein
VGAGRDKFLNISNASMLSRRCRGFRDVPVRGRADGRAINDFGANNVSCSANAWFQVVAPSAVRPQTRAGLPVPDDDEIIPMP